MAEILPPPPAAPTPANGARREGTARGQLVGVLAIGAQGLVIITAILLSPDDDVSFPWVLAIGQAVLGVGLCFWLIARGRHLVALVPVASAVLVAGLTQLGGALGGLTQFGGALGGSVGACSDSELALAAEVAPPAGYVLNFNRPFVGRCSAVLDTDLSAAEVYAHFSAVFAADGWTTLPGQLPGEVTGVKDRVAYQVAETSSGFLVTVYDLHEGAAPEACTQEMRAAAAQLAGPPGGPPEPPQPSGVRDLGCEVSLALGVDPRDDPDAPAAPTAEQVYDHYRAELEAAGWAITSARAPAAITAERDTLGIEITITDESFGPFLSIVVSADEADE